MDQWLQRLAQWLDALDHIASQIQLSEIDGQVLDSFNLVVRQIQDSQVFETQQLLVHGLDVVLLSVERLEEFEKVLFRADVLVEAKLFDDLAQLKSFVWPAIMWRTKSQDHILS